MKTFGIPYQYNAQQIKVEIEKDIDLEEFLNAILASYGDYDEYR